MWLRRGWSDAGDRWEVALATRVGHCADLVGPLTLFTCSIFFSS